MKNADLPEGCEICYAQFGSKNLSGLHARLYDHLAEECGRRVVSRGHSRRGPDIPADRQGAEGEIGSGLETAMAALTMMYFDAWDTPALERAIVRLADDPMHRNGWQPIAYANPPTRAFSDGCAGLTAVFYAEALHRWVTRNESAGGSGDH